MIVIPAKAIAEKRVAGHFIAEGATSPEHAIAVVSLRWPRARALARLRDLGIVHGPEGALWLDLDAWQDRRGTRRKRALALLALGAVSAGIARLTTLR